MSSVGFGSALITDDKRKLLCVGAGGKLKEVHAVGEEDDFQCYILNRLHFRKEGGQK